MSKLDLRMIGQGGAADTQGLVYDAATGLWTPADIVNSVNGDTGEVTIQAYDTIQDEGVALTQRSAVDFQGSGVVVTDDAINDKTIVTVSGSGGGGTGGTVTAYTPSWVGASTSPSIGNGSIAGQYTQLGDKLYNIKIVIKIGSTTTLGSGGWWFTVPAGMSLADPGTLWADIGQAFGRDDSGLKYYTLLALTRSHNDPTIPNTIVVYSVGSGTVTQLSPTVPFSWGTNDQLNISIDVLTT